MSVPPGTGSHVGVPRSTVGGPRSNVGGPVSISGPAPPVAADKYSALAELESAFNISAAAPAAPVNWDSSVISRNTQPTSWGTSTPGSQASWGSPTTGAMFGSSGTAAVPAPSGLMYGGSVVPNAAPAAAFTAAPGWTLISAIIIVIVRQVSESLCE